MAFYSLFFGFKEGGYCIGFGDVLGFVTATGVQLSIIIVVSICHVLQAHLFNSCYFVISKKVRPLVFFFSLL